MLKYCHEDEIICIPDADLSRVVVIGGALAEFKKHILSNDYPELDSSLMKIYLLEAGPRLLNAMSETASNNALQDLTHFGVDVRLKATVKSYDGEVGTLDGGNPILAASLIWSLVHLVSIAGFKNKLMVGLNWAWNYFSYDKGNRLIIRKYKRDKRPDKAPVFPKSEIAK